MKTYYIAGVWDLFHVGHLNVLKAAKIISGPNTLIVGVVSDEHAFEYKKIYPIIPYEQRKIIIEALSIANMVVKQDIQFSIEHMNELGVDAVLLGEDWKNLMPPHLKKMSEKISVQYMARTPDVSTSDIKKRIRCLQS